MWIQALSAIGAVVLASAFWVINNRCTPRGFKFPWKWKFMFAFSRLMYFFERCVKGRGMTLEDGIMRWKSRLNRLSAKEIKDLPVSVKLNNFGGVRVTLFKPKGFPAENNPGILLFHEEEQSKRSKDLNQAYCRDLAHETCAIVVIVHYNSCFEEVFSAGLKDCYTAAAHFINNARTYGVDASRIALYGIGWASYMAAAVSMQLADSNVYRSPKLQVLIRPSLETQLPILVDHYPVSRMTEDLSKLPETLVLTVQHDLFGDIGVQNAKDLKTYGVKVTHVHYDAGFHYLNGWPIYYDEDIMVLHGMIYQHIRENL